MKRMLLGLLLVGCGGDGDSDRPAVDASIDAISPDAKLVDAAPGALTLTSTAFVEGGTIPVAHTCNSGKNGDTSPALTWSTMPNGTKSIAVVLTDNSNKLVHWAIWDIPAAATTLPANIEKVYAPSNVAGAHQNSVTDNLYGYKGPCPPNEHEYQFAIYALDVATLPGATMTSKPATLVPTIKQHQLATATLTGKYAP